MKKILLLFLTCLVLTSCHKQKPVVAEKPFELDVEKVTSLDRQEMFMKHEQNYRWFETCMKLNNFLDEENDGSLEEVVNVFQVVVGDGKTFDVTVFKYQHFANGECFKDSVNGFWVEDEPLDSEPIKITYRQAYEKLMATNCPKPHSRYVTLRKQVGPKDANAQYIFGNTRETVFVDAVTGEVSEINPAFGPEFSKPLGEWP
jgi:hypothetical protein